MVKEVRDAKGNKTIIQRCHMPCDGIINDNAGNADTGKCG